MIFVVIFVDEQWLLWLLIVAKDEEEEEKRKGSEVVVFYGRKGLCIIDIVLLTGKQGQGEGGSFTTSERLFFHRFANCSLFITRARSES